MEQWINSDDIFFFEAAAAAGISDITEKSGYWTNVCIFYLNFQEPLHEMQKQFNMFPIKMMNYVWRSFKISFENVTTRQEFI